MPRYSALTLESAVRWRAKNSMKKLKNEKELVKKAIAIGAAYGEIDNSHAGDPDAYLQVTLPPPKN
jgi:hypothetical protein